MPLLLLKRKWAWLTLAVFLAALLPRVTTLGGTFIVNDEPLYWAWSNEFAAALINRDWYGTLIGIGYPSVTVMWVHTLGAAFRFFLELLQGYPAEGFWSRAALDQPLVFDMLGERRLTMAVANTLLIVFIYWQARWLMGEAVALLGAGLLALAPFLLADARTMRGDALMSSLMLISVLGLLLYIQRGRWLQLVLSGLSLGLALLTKVVAIPVFGFGFAAVAVYVWLRRDWTWPARFRWAITTLAVWGAIAGLVFFALWPALWVAPLEVIAFMRDYARGSIEGRLNFFWGQLTHDEPLPLFYPNAFLFRATPLTVLGVLLAAGIVLVSGWRLLRPGLSRAGRKASLDRLWQMPVPARWTVLALGAYSVIYWLVMNAGALKRDRYLMPVFPAALFIAAVGLLWLINRVRQRWPGSGLPAGLARGRWVWLAFVLVLGWEISQVLATHPFYYTYWSPLMGGGRVAMNVMMAEGGVDSAALVYLNRKPGAAREKVALLTSRDYAPAYVGETVRLSSSAPWITANYVVLRQYHFQTEKMDPDLLAYLYRRPPEHVVEYQGYIWAWVYPGAAARYYAGSLLDGKAELLGYNLSGDTASPQSPLGLKLFWQNRGRVPGEEIFIRLVDAAGFTWAETEGVQPLPGFESVAYQAGAIVEGEAQLSIPAGTPPGLYFLKMGLTGPGDEPDLGEFTLPAGGSRLAVEKPARPVTLAPPQQVNQQLAPGLTLVGFDLDSSLILTPQTPLPATLYWRAEQDLTQDYVLSVRLLNQADQESAYWLGQPTRGLYPSPNWRKGDFIRDPWTLDLSQAGAGAETPPGRYDINVALFDSATGRELGQVSLASIEVSDRPRLFRQPALEQTVGARLGSRLSLVGYNFSQAPLTGGARFIVELCWQALQPVTTSYTVFVQVLGPDGRLVAQHDGLPAGGALPTSAWEKGEFVRDRHQLDFSISQPGQYRLIVGMYDARTGERLPVAEAGDGSGADFLQLYTFTYSE